MKKSPSQKRFCYLILPHAIHEILIREQISDPQVRGKEVLSMGIKKVAEVPGDGIA